MKMQEYRDYARQELQDGYQRNPAISAGAEVVGAVASPIKPFKTKGYFDKSWGKFVAHPEDIAQARWLNTVGTGVINGVGYTNQNTPEEYAKNIGISTIGNFTGNKIKNRLFGVNDMYKKSRAIIDGLNNFGVSATNNFINKRWDKDEDDY